MVFPTETEVIENWKEVVNKDEEKGDMQKELGHIQFVEETLAEDGSSLVTFEVDAAATKLISSVGLRFIVTCAAYGLDLEDGFKAVNDRGEYLQQEPEKEFWDIGE